VSPRRTLTHIDRYEIIKLLGRGGMGTVYLCSDPDLQRSVAVKVLSAKKGAQALPALRLRFLREALTTARLQHPGIPPVYDVRQQANGQIYYVMKPIEGRPLVAVLQDLRAGVPKTVEEFDLYRLIQVLREVCQTLQYAHNKGYIHRDLKPANIFVGDFGEVYIIDWGLTKVLRDALQAGAAPPPEVDEAAVARAEAEAEALTRTRRLEEAAPSADTGPSVDRTLTMQGDVLGTLSYMPPEQASGKMGALGRQADVYALGVILYEMLTLELPIRGESFRDILAQKVRGDVVPAERRAVTRDIPPELSAIATQAMNPAPEERIKSVKEFSDALEFWLEGKSQFRPATKSVIDPADFQALPRDARKAWEIHRDAITTGPAGRRGRGDNVYLLFEREFAGDIRFSVNVIAYPLAERADRIAEFALVLNATVPKPWQGFVDGYSIHFGASRNTRAFISKNDVEVVSNEHLVLEPRRRYRLTVERSGNDIRVMVNRQVVLFYHDTDPLTGLRLGLLHKGSNVAYFGIRVQTRGLPTSIAAIEVPEALMAEGCHEGALKRFLAIAQGHKDRYEGAWARFRAGIASYRLDGDRRKALRIWAPLRKSAYPTFEKLGRAMLSLEANRPLQAAETIGSVLAGGELLPRLDPVADIVFAQAQQRLRQRPTCERDWRVVDAWVRLALVLGQRVEGKRSMTPSVLWRWMLLALTDFPGHLADCIRFVRDTFGTGQGHFAEVLTTFDPLMTILRRSAGMADHAFLMDKVMRLILNHDDNLGNLETLVRFYLHSGHEGVARQISSHIYSFCLDNDYAMPPGPMAFIACLAWVKREKDARELIQVMIDRSADWAVHDGRLLLGLDHYGLGQVEDAERCWREFLGEPDAAAFNRHLVAQGLLGDLPADPVEAEVPHRSDHRLLYCLFLGFRYFLDWERTGEDRPRDTAVRLLSKTLELMRPSYDIYSATDTFVRVLLEAMGCATEPAPEPESLSREEEGWLQQLTAAAAKEKPDEGRRPSSQRRPGSRRKSGPRPPTPRGGPRS